MSRSIVELYEEKAVNDPGSLPFGLLPTRNEVVESLKSGRIIDVVIVGNDLPCAIAAQLLALNGVRVLLLTPGPLTPLGAASVIDVLECSRVPLLNAVRYLPALVKRGKSLARYAPHRMVTVTGNKIAHNHSLGAKLLSIAGIPAVLDDGATVAEALLAARRDGAVVLPYGEPLYLEMVGDSGIRIMGVRDRLSGEVFEVRSGGVVVGHGVPVPGSRLREGSAGKTVVSGGAVAQYEVLPRTQKVAGFLPAAGGSILQKLPLKGNGDAIALRRASGGYLLSVTLSDVGEEFEGITEEIGLSIGEVVASVLVPKGSFLSGEELIHGKGVIRIPSSSPLIAFSIANKLVYLYARSAARAINEVVSAEKLTNPGSLQTRRSGVRSPIEIFKEEATQALVSPEMLEQAIARWGDRVRYIGDCNDGFSMLGGKMLRGELGIAVLADQVIHVDDLPQSLLRCRIDEPQERESIQSEIVALQQGTPIQSERGQRKTV
jgi:hypothetical protein